MKRPHELLETKSMDMKMKALNALSKCGQRKPCIALDLDYTVSSFLNLSSSKFS
jgi:hypothetical protein